MCVLRNVTQEGRCRGQAQWLVDVHFKVYRHVLTQSLPPVLLCSMAWIYRAIYISVRSLP